MPELSHGPGDAGGVTPPGLTGLPSVPPPLHFPDANSAPACSQPVNKSLQQALEWLQLQLKVCSLGTVPALRALTLAVVTLQ